MPSRLNTNFARSKDADEFESLVRDLCAREWNDPSTEKFGRSGQKQYGVDVYGRPSDANGRYRGAQCKLRTKGDPPSEAEIENEVREANRFPHPLDTLIIATDASRDTNTQIVVDQINERQMREGSFGVRIWFWDSITERLAAYPDLIVAYYPDYFANLTTLPFVKDLVGTPLQVIFLANESARAIPLQTGLKLRGIRVMKAGPVSDSVSVAPALVPDGLVYYYSAPAAGADPVAILKFAGLVVNHLSQVDARCPVFLILGEENRPALLDHIKTLGGEPDRLQMLVDNSATIDLANHVFRAVFDYGYSRRGALPTIDITARATPTTPGSALLDLDWSEALSIVKLPTPSDWEAGFAPAVNVVGDTLARLGDQTRIQVNSQLPVPAAFSIGFYLNIRVARLGVWTRKTGSSDFKCQLWMSDSVPSTMIFPTDLQVLDRGHQSSAVVELTTFVDIAMPVDAFAKESGLNAGTRLQVCMERPDANITESDAVAFANYVGERIRLLNAQGVTDIHLFARIPSALAVLVGQRLQACGRIHLYWFDNPTYRYAFTLK